MAPQKIRFSLPEFINEIIESDVSKFRIKKNKLSNMIFEKFKYNYKPFTELVDENNISFQFNLNNDNAEIYRESYSEFFNDEIDTQAVLFRSLFYTYINYPADRREIIIYNDIYNSLIEAINQNRQIRVKYNGKFRVIEPFFISSTKEERFNYACCYCYKNEKVVNYRLSNIEKIIESKNPQKNRNEEKIEEYKKNFDPYLSFNKKVKIKLTKEGIRLYGKFTFTPEILEKFSNETENEGAIYIVEASSLKAKLFFPQFMDEVEVLEPVELREWFWDKIKKMGRIYK